MVLYAAGRTSTYPDEPPASGFRFHYLGGGDEVGNVGIVMEDPSGTRLLLDYGIAPTSPPRYPSEAPLVHDAVITHSHIDHLGMAPWLCAHHRTRLHGTIITAQLSDMMWRDTYKVSSIERYPLAWDKRDIDTAVDSWYVHDFGAPWKHHDWDLTLHPAGHIPGAAMLHIKTPTTTVLLTGDFDTRDSPLVSGAQPVQADILFVEGTYGGRDHPPKEEEIERFIQAVAEVVRRGGTVLIPAFANGRTQDVVMLLHRHLRTSMFMLTAWANGWRKHTWSMVHFCAIATHSARMAMGKTSVEQIRPQKSTICRCHRCYVWYVERWSSALVPQSLATRCEKLHLFHRISSQGHRRSFLT